MTIAEAAPSAQSVPIPQSGGEIVGYIIVMILTGGLFTGLQALRKFLSDIREGRVKERRDVLEVNGEVATSTIELLQGQMVRQDQWYQKELDSIQSRLNAALSREKRLDRLVRIYEDTLSENGVSISPEPPESEVEGP